MSELEDAHLTSQIRVFHLPMNVTWTRIVPGVICTNVVLETRALNCVSIQFQVSTAIYSRGKWNGRVQIVQFILTHMEYRVTVNRNSNIKNIIYNL